MLKKYHFTTLRIISKYILSGGDRGGNGKTRAEQLGIDVGSSRKSGYRDFGSKLFTYVI